MNKVLLMGRLVKDPEVRYSQSSEPLAIARYTLAVNRRFKREGEPDADFINCTAFGKAGEFTERYFKKGQMVAVVGRLQVRAWDDQSGQRHWSTEVIVEEQHFAESKASFESSSARATSAPKNDIPPVEDAYNSPKVFNQPPDGFSAIAESLDDEELPF